MVDPAPSKPITPMTSLASANRRIVNQRKIIDRMRKVIHLKDEALTLAFEEIHAINKENKPLLRKIIFALGPDAANKMIRRK